MQAHNSLNQKSGVALVDCQIIDDPGSNALRWATGQKLHIALIFQARRLMNNHSPCKPVGWRQYRRLLRVSIYGVKGLPKFRNGRSRYFRPFGKDNLLLLGYSLTGEFSTSLGKQVYRDPEIDILYPNAHPSMLKKAGSALCLIFPIPAFNALQAPSFHQSIITSAFTAKCFKADRGSARRAHQLG